jgi:hypothetical protein
MAVDTRKAGRGQGLNGRFVKWSPTVPIGSLLALVLVLPSPYHTRELFHSARKMEAGHSSETLINTYKTTWHHIANNNLSEPSVPQRHLR